MQVDISVSPVFKPFFDPRYDGVDKWYLYGGRDFGKSVHVSIKQLMVAIDRSMQLKTGRVLACRSTQKNVENSVLAELKNAALLYPQLASRFLIGQKYLRTKDGRISFAFEGTNINPIGLKGVSGVFFGMVDEADAMTQQAIEFFEPTVRAEDGKIVYCFNPTTQSTPLAKQFLREINGARGRPAEQNLYRSFVDFKRRIGVIFGTYKDNHYLSVASSRRILRAQETMDAGDFANIYGGRFISAGKGAYYGRRLAEAYEAGHICPLEYNANLPTYAVWDLGMNDLTVAVVFQITRDRSGGKDDRIMIVDCLYGNGFPIDYYAEQMQARGYGMAKCFLPHDGAAMRGYTTTETAETVLRSMNFSTQVIPNQGKAAAMKRIIRLRTDFPKLWFNQGNEGVKFLLESLSKYAPKVANEVATDTPDHTWSDACDAAGLIPYVLESEYYSNKYRLKDYDSEPYAARSPMAF